MKTFTKTLLVAILFISAVWVKQANAQNSVSGHVRYSDNNELVTGGHVKVYNMSGQLLALQPINGQGEFYVSNLQPIVVDIIAVAPDAEEDFPPTYFPDTDNPLNAISILISGTITNHDIFVERMEGGDNPNVSKITGNISSNNSGLEDAVIYAKQNDKTLGYAITSKNGSFEITGLPLGDYILVAHKKGFASVIRNVTVTENGINTSFSMERTAKQIAGLTPVQFSLSQNYPNPFNPSTKINYTLAKDSKVTLAVYNTNGELIQSIVNGFQNSGTYNVQFDAKNIATGVYYYKLETESFTQTRKMILIK